MSKADVIEIEGVVVEKLPNAIENEFYQNSSGRQGYTGDVTV